MGIWHKTDEELEIQSDAIDELISAADDDSIGGNVAEERAQEAHVADEQAAELELARAEGRV